MPTDDEIKTAFGAFADSHSWEVEQVVDHFHVDLSKGLSDEQAERQRAKFGRNEFPPEESTPLWKLILEQFEDTLVIILICAALVSLFLAFFEEDEHERTTAFVEPLVIVLILVANATVGVLQESSAEAAVEALKAYESPHAVVLRSGVLRTVDAAELVPGDVVEVAVGDLVPADVRVCEKQSSSIKVSQGLLTGESESVSKNCEPVKPKAQVQDKTNTLFAGTSVERGKCRGVVIGTGIFTEKGKIRDQLQSTETEDSPLKKKLDEFGNQLSYAIFGVCILVWAINIGHFSDPAFGGVWRGAIYYFKIAVSLAVAAIPEGLPAVVTTCLALGTQRMAAKNAIVTKLSAVETLGCTNVICSDKTGTLTTNQMSVLQFFVLNDSLKIQDCSVEGDTYATAREDGSPFSITDTETGRPIDLPSADNAIRELSLVSSLCNDSRITVKDGRYEKIGQATEAALRVLVEKLGLPDKKSNDRLAKLAPEERVQYCNALWEDQYKKEFVCEFSRDRKSMGVLVSNNNEQKLLVKGAWDAVVNRCSHVLLSSGKRVEMSAKVKGEIMCKVRDYCTGTNHYRCLALAYRDGLPKGFLESLKNVPPEEFEKFETNLTFVGVTGILDPPRVEVRDAIMKCKTAGIDVIVITGDNKATAAAICRKIGVFGERESIDGKAFEGAEFKEMSAQQRLDCVKEARLFARVEPVDKKDLVDILHKHNKIVAMTGDGVNDAPALKAADIGLAMGSGTAVAKGAAEMVLADDNFTTIVAAVEEGRNIYNNTKQFIRYLITANIGEVVAIFIAAVVGLPEMLLPVQLLWVNLVTDGLPAVALGFNKGEEGIMNQPPRQHDEPIISRFTLGRYVITGSYVGIATVLGMLWWYCVYEDGPQLEYSQLFEWARCDENTVLAEGVGCDVFEDNSPGTVSLSILVTIEMLCALNSVSERQSMFSRYGNPLRNLYLIVAMCISFGLHFVILYVPFLQRIFQVEPLNFDEWATVFLLSFPVIIVDEVFKFILRVQDSIRLRRLKLEQDQL